MFDFTDPNTVWLNLTNLGLGLVTIIAVVVVGVTIAREITERIRLRVPATQPDESHELFLADLGLTMADGGEPVNGAERPEDAPGIIRSEN